MSNIFLDFADSKNLNDRNDLSRMAYQNTQNDIPVRNTTIENQIERTFENPFLNHKESFDQNNDRLNSLNDEIRGLKGKLKLIYEKDEIIQSQKQKLNQLKNENQLLLDQNKSFKKELDLFQKKELEYQQLKDENIRFKQEIQDLNETQKEKEEMIETEGYKSETIQINLPEIKSILCRRLKTQHEKHIDNLINEYELHNKKEIEKETMEKLLLEAIHLK